jgi:RND family efflux transporter MFP subunit
MENIGRFLSLLGMVFMVGCTDGETKTLDAVKKVPVEVIQVRQQPRAEVLNLLGTVEAKREVKLAFKIGGKIKKLSCEEGQSIKTKALLAKLDTTELLARREQAMENKNKAKRDLDRMGKLFKKRIVPESSFQDARSLLISAEAELNIVEDKLKHSTIEAPFTGRITQKLTEVGEIVSPGMPVAILTQMDPILVKAAVPDNLIGKIKTGQTVHIRVDSHPHEKFRGSVHRLETTADPLSRTFKMEIELGNSDEMLRPGLIARVEVPFKEKGNGIFIPLDSVMGFGPSPSVFVVKNQIAERRMIKIGRILGEDTEVMEGLAAGEMLVVSGQEYLKHGQQVLMDQKEPVNG